MKFQRCNLIALSVLILLPQRAWADVAFGLFEEHWPAVIPVILIEICIFQYLFNRLFFRKKIVKNKIDIGKTIFIVLCANVVSTVFGTLIEEFYDVPSISHQFVAGKAVILGVAFLLTAFLEWIVYIPFFRRVGERRKTFSNLFKVSFAVNVIPYVLIAALILSFPHPADDPGRNPGSRTMSIAKSFYNAAMAHIADKGASIPEDGGKLVIRPEDLPWFEVPPSLTSYIVIEGGPLIYDPQTKKISFKEPMVFRHKNAREEFVLTPDGEVEIRADK